MGDILEILVGIIVVLGVFFFVFVYFPAMMAKMTNTRLNVRRGGRKGATFSPSDFDDINESIKNHSVKLFNNLKSASGKVIDKVKQHKIEKVVFDKTKSKLEKLAQLNDLRQSNTITQEEFELLKIEILKD